MELARRRMKPPPADCNAVLRARMKKDGLPCMLAGGLSECIQRPLQLARALKEHEHPPALPPDVILAQHHGRPLLQPIGHEANFTPRMLVCPRECAPRHEAVYSYQLSPVLMQHRSYFFDTRRTLPRAAGVSPHFHSAPS